MANITTVHLLNVPLEKDYAHTLHFADATEQRNYLIAKRRLTYENFSYQRKDNIIRIPEHIDRLIYEGCNYVMYKNAAYSDKWFYAFITDMQYVNDGRTDVTIKTDCIQTWMFDIDVKPSFVEREHAASDKRGDYTIDEALETGEFVVNDMYSVDYGSEMAIIIGVTRHPDNHAIFGGGKYSGMYSGIKYYAFSETDTVAIENFLKKYDEGYAESVMVMFLAPRYLAAGGRDTIAYGEPVVETGVDLGYSVNNPYDTAVYAKETTHQFFDGKVDGYTPRNNKLLCFPFNYLLATNNAGASAVYKYERFYTEDSSGKKTLIQPAFVIKGCLTPGCSVRLIPDSYNGSGTGFNYDEGLTMGKFPILNWTSDAYTNWLTQNSVNIGIQIATGVGQIIGGAALALGTGGLGAGIGGGSVVGGATTIANTLAQVHQQSFAPPQVNGNLNSGDVTAAMRKNTFMFYNMSVKKEIAMVIDNFFDMYGYKCNRVKIPEKEHRACYWYTKTIDANITGDIPQEDLQTIKDCYNRGITFWMKTADFRNYDPEKNNNRILV